MRLSFRTLALGLVFGLAACGGKPSSPQLASGPQGTRVADVALDAGNPQMALQWTNTILASDPRNVDALLRNGRANLMMNNVAAAESSYRKVLAIDARQTEARIAVAKMVMGSQPAAAEKMFQAVLADEPRNVGVLNNYGVCLDLQGRHGDAQAAYRRALSIAPELASAQQNSACRWRCPATARKARPCWVKRPRATARTAGPATTSPSPWLCQAGPTRPGRC